MHTESRALPIADNVYRRILDALHDGVYFVTRDQRICYWNRGAERLTGYAADEVLGRRCSANVLMHVDAEGRSLCVEGCPLQQSLQDGREREADLFLRHKDGHRCAVHVRISPLRDEGGTIIGAVEIFGDNTRYAEMEQLLRTYQEQALLDDLTGVSNRRHAQMLLASRLHEFERYGISTAVFFLDIDHFKKINDQYGHEAGDGVIRMVAQTLRQMTRFSDHVSRWGGEEFLVIMSSVAPEELHPLADRMRTLVGTAFLQQDDVAVHVTVSVGATLFMPGDTVETLIARADNLMYQSKLRGRNRVTVDDDVHAGV